MRVLIVVDPIERLQLFGDSTYAMMLEAARRNIDVWTCQVEHLSLEHEDVVAAAQQTTIRDAETAAEAFDIAERTSIPLSAFNAVFMRADPPLDVRYLQATWLLEQARRVTKVINDPRGLRELNEHLSILRFPELIPPTIVTSDRARLKSFLDEQGGTIVVKPVDGYGGRGIFLVRLGDPNTSSILDQSTVDGTMWTMAQRYLPEAKKGDKRILVIGGEPVGAVLRVPPEGEARDNLHVGGTAEKTEIEPADWTIIRAVRPLLAEYGILFAGLDVIGGRLTEINITSPTGMRHVDRLDGISSAAPLFDLI